MKYTYRIMVIIAVFVTAMVGSTVSAQEVSPVDFMRMNPYQLKANPSTDLPYESVMSMVVGNIGINVQNATLHYDNLFAFDAQGRPSVLDLRKFANSLKTNNYMGISANVDLFNLCRRLEKGLLSVDHRIKVEGDMRYNNGLFMLLGYGNSAFVGANNPAHLSMNVNAQVRQEFAVGYQRKVNNQLSVGGRVKMLFGAANITTNVIDAKLYTDPDTYALGVEEKLVVYGAMPDVFYFDEDGQFKTNGHFRMANLFRNPGFGVDLAATYQFNEQFSAVAAVHDLGFMHWGSNGIAMTSEIKDVGQFYENGGFHFGGLEMEQLILLIDDMDYREQFFDTLQQYVQLQFSPKEKYNTMLNTNLLLRGNYDLDANNRFSAQLQGKFCGSGFRPALTLAYAGSFNRMFDVCATYTIMRGSYDNLGLGVAGNFGTFHIYLTTNNVFGFFMPLNASAMNAQVGIVFNLWPEKTIIDESGMPEYLE